jgi:hypothetical protein
MNSHMSNPFFGFVPERSLYLHVFAASSLQENRVAIPPRQVAEQFPQEGMPS